MTRGGLFETFPQALEFISRLLKSFVFGFAIASGISLLVLPRTCRGGVFGDVRRFVWQTDAVLASLEGFLQTMRDTPKELRRASAVDPDSDPEVTDQGQTQPLPDSISQARDSLTASVNVLNSLNANIQSGLYYSKNEVAWGKLSPSDMSQISDLLRNLIRPLSGMALFPGILHSSSDLDPITVHMDDTQEDIQGHGLSPAGESLRICVSDLRDIMASNLQYFLLKVELISIKQLGKQKARPYNGLENPSLDGELRNPDPADPNFIAKMERRLKRLPSRQRILSDIFPSLNALPEVPEPDLGSDLHEADLIVQPEHFLVLYMVYLRDMVIEASAALTHFAHNKVTDGVMSRSRLIYPKDYDLGKLFSPDEKPDSSSSHMGSSAESHQSAERREVADAEHLAPVNFWEREGRRFGAVVRLIGSNWSMFGLRASIASFCIGILAYLHQTQDFFIRQRVVWAMIVIVIGMGPTSGQSLLGFLTRILATIIALALSLIAWYIVDGKTPGVIIFLFLANMVLYHPYIKKPQYFGPSIIAIVTLNVIIGYELQVYKLGREVSESHGQPYYPIYIFGPYKLAAILAGCAVSFFWVIFPYPITAKSTVPRLVGQSLFNLARFYSVMHATAQLWINGQQGAVGEGTSSPHTHLESVLRGSYKKQAVLLEGIRKHIHFATYEPPFGGKFPTSLYSGMVTSSQQMLNIMSLMAYIALNVPRASSDVENPAGETGGWGSQLALAALEETHFQSQSTTSLLCHLGSAMMNRQPLPPFLAVPESFPLARQLLRLNTESLHAKNVQYPAFAAFVSLEVLRTMVNFELKVLLETTRVLVGEMKFDIYV
ncbi:uncharacterized protein DNG_08924 [Cephalotrichum gorgonifer]|uniref:Integral membrane bound transporter domain-containing protein n=1 Tax=Cephalotrichum gorgonifer TaxID=2041049 RepID=A0AAE8N7K6_9PEZI|nr:uncharacterized protein DNG_08924 [Cephalotrichum gorgonifer]